MKRLLFFTLLLSSSMYGAVADEQVPKKRRIEDGKTITVKTSDGQFVEVPKGYFSTLDDCVSNVGEDNLAEEGIPLEHITATDLDGAVALAEKRPGIITEGVLAALYYLGYPRALPAVYSAWLQKDENKKEPIHRGTEKQLLQHMGLDRKKCAGDMYEQVWNLSAGELIEVRKDKRNKCIRKKIGATEEEKVEFIGSNINSLCCLHTYINPEIVTKLDLSRNELTEIRLDSLNQLQALQELDLSRNRLTKIDAKSFVGLNRLQKLRLCYNRIEFIDSETFADLCYVLQELDLSFNELVTLSAKSFSCPSFSLQKLNLNWNKLKDLDVNVFAYLLRLQTLDLRYNPLKSENIKHIRKALPNVEVLSLFLLIY